MRALLRPDFGRVASSGALVALLALVAGGCKREKQPPPQGDDGKAPATTDSAHDNASPAEAPAAPTIRLIETGSDPLRKIRYEYQQGREENVVMDIAMTVEVIVPGLPSRPIAVPSLRLGMHLSTEEITSAGARYRFELTQAEILGKEDVPPMLLESMQSARDQLLTLKGEGLVDSQGISRTLSVDLGPGLREETAQLVESAKRSLNQMSAPIPAAPVGVGAIWEVRQSLLENGVEVDQIAQVELKKMDEKTLELAMSIAQTGTKQEVQLPGAPAGESLVLNSLRGTGTATLSVSLDSFVPSRATVEIDRHSEVLRDGRTTTMVLKSKIDLSRSE